jgi:hypothetical protein
MSGRWRKETMDVKGPKFVGVSVRRLRVDRSLLLI